MSDMIEVPKIRVFLRTDRVDAEAPPLRFLRWKLVPLPGAQPTIEPDAAEDDDPVEAKR